MKTVTIIATVWGILLCLLFVFAPILAELLWVGYLGIHWAFPLAGAVLFIVAIILSIRRRKVVWGSIVITIVGLVLFFTEGFRFGRLALFEIRRPRYERLLEESERSGEVPDGEGYTDDGPPVRHAFFWQRGVVDNWAGVVYDPSGLVAKVNGSSGWDDLYDPRWSNAVRLFGGTLYHCERLSGDWYLCWFT